MTYPTSLPPTLAEGYSREYKPGAVLRTQVDDGSYIHRRITDSEISTVVLNWRVSEEQRQVLAAYLWHEGGRGENYLDFPITAVTSVRAKQTGPLETEFLTTEWRVKATFEIEPVLISMLPPGTIVSWPAELPASNGGSFTMEVLDLTTNETAAYSPSVARGRFQTEPTIYNIKIVLDAAQHAIHKDFYEKKVGGMSGWFTFPIPIRGPARCRYASPPKEVGKSSFYEITFQLESEVSELLSYEMYLELKDLLPGAPLYFITGYLVAGYYGES